MSSIELTKELGRSKNGLMDYALSLTRDQTDANDLFQETAYRALKNIHLFQPNTNLRAWLMTIMRNVFINAYRKKRRRQVLQDGTSNLFLIDSTYNTVTNQGELKVNYDELVGVIDRLEDYLKIPFMMAYNGYKYGEIAKQLDVPLGTIKSRIFMARQRIKNIISHHYAVREKKEVSAA